MVTEQRLLCGDWDIPLAETERISYRPFGGVFSRGMVLTVLMRDGKSYQFGLGKPEAWLKPFPMEVHAESSFGPNQAVLWAIRAALAALLLKDLL